MEQNVEDTQSVQVQPNSGNVLVKKLGLILSVFVFLLPVFFMPVSGVSLYVAKITLLATGLVAIFAIFMSSVLSTGAIEIPKVKYLLPVLLFAVVSLLSSVFSGSISSSIVGSTFEIGTSGSILMLVFAMFMTILSVKSIGTMSKIISAFIYGSLALAVYTLLGTFGATLLPVALASRMPIFLAGGAIDTAIIFGAVIIFALCLLNMTEVSKRMKIILYVLMAFAMIFIGAANFMPVVITLSIISLVFFVYILSWSVGKSGSSENNVQESTNRKISLSSLAILLATVILIMGGSGIAGFLSKTMKVQSVEVRPNFQTTMDLTISSWKQNALLGIGPNRFVEFWAMHKPAEINQTQFWNAEFPSGSGFIPTIAITTGILGLLSLLAFIGMYVLSGVKAIFAQANAGRSRYISTASFLVSFYLWVMLFLYTPSVAVLALAFIFTGIFTATLVPQGVISVWKINIFSNPKTNFLSVLSIVVLLVVSVAGGYFVWERSAASVVFQDGVIAYQNSGDVSAVRASTMKAVGMVPSDIYWRGLTEISLTDLGKVLGSITDANKVSDEVKNQAQGLIADAVQSAKKATELDGSNFQNWFALGRVYEVLASNGIEGSIENARSAYAEAIKLSPSNPAVPLALARLDALEGKTDSARENINKALALKSNYTDAHYTLAQLEVSANNISAAIKSVEATVVLDPSNSGLYFQLGLLNYNEKNYAGAAGAFEKAISLVPDYANAKYFLGLTYARLNRTADAIAQFTEIQKTNPENTEVATILKSLQDGKSPFTDVKPAINDKLKSGTTLPVKGD